MSGLIEREGPPLEPSPLSFAFARRLLYQDLRSATRIAQLSGEPTPRYDFLAREELSGTIALQVERLTQTTNPTFQRLIVREISYQLTESYATAQQAAMFPVPMFHSRFLAEEFVDKNSEGETATYVGRINAEMEEAKLLAQEKGISPVKVFSDDTLYDELTRRVTNLTDFAQELLRRFNQQRIHPNIRRAVITHEYEEIIRIWGIEGFNTIPRRLRRQLMPDA